MPGTLAYDARRRSDASPARRTLDVPAELLPQRRQDLLGERRLLAGAEPGVERGRQHVRRHVLVDRGLDRPAAFAGVVDEAGVGFERAVLAERDLEEVQQPR